MLDYDTLKQASDWADLSPDMDIADWAESEGMAVKELEKFAIESGIKLLKAGADQGVINPLVYTTMGVIFGIRIANLAHRTKNPVL